MMLSTMPHATTHCSPFYTLFHFACMSPPDPNPNPLDPASLALTFLLLNNNLNPHDIQTLLSLSPLSLKAVSNSSMENTLNSTKTMPAFKRKLEMGGAVQMRSSTRKRRVLMKEEEQVVEENSCTSCSEEEEENKEEVEKKIVALQRMVPGGEMLGVDKLFEETAGYILALQSQIKALRVLASFIQGLEKEKRKFGG